MLRHIIRPPFVFLPRFCNARVKVKEITYNRKAKLIVSSKQ